MVFLGGLKGSGSGLEDLGWPEVAWVASGGLGGCRYAIQA